MALRRMHLFEVGDSAWAPRPLRDTIVESLSHTLAWGHVLAGLVKPFERFLAATGAREVLDVCAGAGGPARILQGELRRAGRTPPRFILTDLHPQVHAWEAARQASPEDLAYEPTSVDATRIPAAVSAGRPRVILNAFHHFQPELAQAILADAVESSAGVFIAEPFERNPLRFLSLMPAGTLALLATPFLTRRERLLKLLLTVTLLAPLASLWDGVVSALRVYRRNELFSMITPFGDRFEWAWGQYRHPFGGKGYYFYGVPRAGSAGVTRAGSAGVPR